MDDIQNFLDKCFPVSVKGEHTQSSYMMNLLSAGKSDSLFAVYLQRASEFVLGAGPERIRTLCRRSYEL